MKTVIVDIDGTVSEVGDRLKYLKETPVNWDAFYEACFEDKPIQSMVDLVNILSKHYHIVFVTGRRESVRTKTEYWIEDHFDKLSFVVLMRPNNDIRHDTHVKPEQLLKYGIDTSDVAFILEDRNSMVKEWRTRGFKCLQVSEGDF